MTRLFLIGLLLLTVLSPTFARDCQDDTISEVDGDGAIITMLSGHVYRISDADQVDTALWMATEDVLVCQSTYQGHTFYEIINKEENGEKVDAERLK